MTACSEALDRDREILDRLAQLDMSFAQHIHDCALATTDPKEVGDLSRSYQRVSRSVRQTLHLKHRLDALGDRTPREPDGKTARKATIRKAVQDRIRLEADPSELRELFDSLDVALEFEAVEDDFLDIPIEDLITRLCEEYEVTPPPAPDPDTS